MKFQRMPSYEQDNDPGGPTAMVGHYRTESRGWPPPSFGETEPKTRPFRQPRGVGLVK